LTLAAFGGIGKTLAALLPDIRYHVEQGLGNAASYLVNTGDFRDAPGHALIFEPYACKGGCANGSGVGSRASREEKNFLTRGEHPDINNILKLFSRYDETLKLEDFCKK
jgi:iron only hydrogenase large subunit-like protein